MRSSETLNQFSRLRRDQGQTLASAVQSTLGQAGRDGGGDAFLLDLVALVLREVHESSGQGSQRYLAMQVEALGVLLPNILSRLDARDASDQSPSELHDLVVDLFFRALPAFGVPAVRSAHAARAPGVLSAEGNTLQVPEHQELLRSLWRRARSEAAGLVGTVEASPSEAPGRSSIQAIAASLGSAGGGGGPKGGGRVSGPVGKASRWVDCFAAAAFLRGEQAVDTVPRTRRFGGGEISECWAEHLRREAGAMRDQIECRSKGAGDLEAESESVVSCLAGLYWVAQGHFESVVPTFRDAIGRLVAALRQVSPGEWAAADAEDVLAVLFKNWAALDGGIHFVLTRWFRELYAELGRAPDVPRQIPEGVEAPEAPTLHALLVGEPEVGKSSFLAACHTLSGRQAELVDEQDPARGFASVDPGYVPIQAHTPAELLEQFRENAKSLTSQQNVGLMVRLAGVGTLMVADIPGGMLHAPAGAQYRVNDPWLKEHVERRHPFGLVILTADDGRGGLLGQENLEALAHQMSGALGSAVPRCPVYILVNKVDLRIQGMAGDEASLERLRREAYGDPEGPPVCSTRYEVPVGGRGGKAPILEILTDRRPNYLNPALARFNQQTARKAQGIVEALWNKGFRDFTVHHVCLLSDAGNAATKAWNVLRDLAGELGVRTVAQQRLGLQRIGAELSAVRESVRLLEDAMAGAGREVQRARDAWTRLAAEVKSLKVGDRDLEAWSPGGGGTSLPPKLSQGIGGGSPGVGSAVEAFDLPTARAVEETRRAAVGALRSAGARLERVLEGGWALLGVLVDETGRPPEALATAYVSPEHRPLDPESSDRLVAWTEQTASRMGEWLDPARSAPDPWTAWQPCVTFLAGALVTGCPAVDLPWSVTGFSSAEAREVPLWERLADGALPVRRKVALVWHLTGGSRRTLETTPPGSRNARHLGALREMRGRLAKCQRGVVEKLLIPVASLRLEFARLVERLEELSLNGLWSARLRERLTSLALLKDPMATLEAELTRFQKALEEGFRGYAGEPLAGVSPFGRFDPHPHDRLSVGAAEAFVAHAGKVISDLAKERGGREGFGREKLAVVGGRPPVASLQAFQQKVEQHRSAVLSALDSLKGVERLARERVAAVPGPWGILWREGAELPDLWRSVYRFRDWQARGDLVPVGEAVVFPDFPGGGSAIPKDAKECPELEGLLRCLADTAARWMAAEGWFESGGVGEASPELIAGKASLEAWCQGLKSGQLVTVLNEKKANPTGREAVRDLEARQKPLLAELGQIENRRVA